MKKILLALAFFLAASQAQAAIPLINATCPMNIEVHADQGGPVFVNGERAELQTFNENYYEASLGGVTISITISPDGSPSLSYTAKGGANGICQVAAVSGAADPDFADGLSGGPDYWVVTDVPADDVLNVRGGPGTGEAVIGALGNGDVVRNRGCRMLGQSRWCQIEVGGDQAFTGWVNGRYLRESGPPSAASGGGGGGVAEQACRNAVAAKVGIDAGQIVTLDVMSAEAGVGVTLQVPGADAPWSCLSDENGNVQGVMYMGER